MPNPQTKDKLRGARLKIERANEHIDNLAVGVADFLKTRPYEIATQRDPQTKRLLYVVSRVGETPIHLSVIAGDVIQNVRTALDYLAYDLFVAATGGTLDGKGIYFPITKHAAKFRSEGLGKIKGLRPDAIKAISDVEPYGGGKGEELWRLHCLSIAEKHRVLTTVGSQYRSLDLGSHIHSHLLSMLPANTPVDFPPMFLNVKDRKFPLEVGDILFSDYPDAEVNEKMQFRFEVALNEPGVVEGRPLIETLKGMCDLTGHIIFDLAALIY